LTSDESKLADLLSDKTWCNKVAFLADISQGLNTLNKRRMKIFLLVLTKINSFKEKLTLWGATVRKENEVEMFVLTESCRLDKNL
jgi:hypothetical protein